MGCHLWFHMSDDLLFRKKISGKKFKGSKNKHSVNTNSRAKERIYFLFRKTNGGGFREEQ